MDPITVAATISEMISKFHASVKSDGELGMPDDVRTLVLKDAGVYHETLNEVAQKALSVQQQLPASVEGCLNLCRSYSTQFGDLLSLDRGRAGAMEELRQVLGDFRASSMLLRSIIMDTITSALHVQQQGADRRIDGDVEIYIDNSHDPDLAPEMIKTLLRGSESRIKGNIKIYATRDIALLHRTYLESRLAADRKQAALAIARTTADDWSILVQAKPTKDGPGSRFKAMIMKVDTQSPYNWASGKAVSRLELSDELDDLEEPIVVGHFGEGTIEAEGKVSLTWYQQGVGQTRETDFLVNMALEEFDLIVGQDFIRTEGLNPLEGKHVMPIRSVRKTSDDIAAQRRHVAEQNGRSEALDEQRRAKEKEKRNRRYGSANASVSSAVLALSSRSSAQTPQSLHSSGSGSGFDVSTQSSNLDEESLRPVGPAGDEKAVLGSGPGSNNDTATEPE